MSRCVALFSLTKTKTKIIKRFRPGKLKLKLKSPWRLKLNKNEKLAYSSYDEIKTKTPRRNLKTKNDVLYDETQFKPYAHVNFIKSEFLGTRWYSLVVGAFTTVAHCLYFRLVAYIRACSGCNNGICKSKSGSTKIKTK